MPKFLRRLTLCCFCLCIAGPALAGSIVVAPTTIRLASPGDMGLLYVTNMGKAPVHAQIEAFKWDQPDGKDSLVPSSDVVISPPMAAIAPGNTQTVRFRMTGAAVPGQEGTYRLMVSEIPDAPLAAGTGVNMLLQFSVPVFVAGGSPPSLVWSASLAHETLTLSAHNPSGSHVRMTEVSLSDHGHDAVMRGLFYILPGASRTWQMPVTDLAPGDHVQVKGDSKDGIPLTADIVVQD